MHGGTRKEYGTPNVDLTTVVLYGGDSGREWLLGGSKDAGGLI